MEQELITLISEQICGIEDHYQIQKTDAEEARELHTLIMQVWEEMPDKELFVVDGTTIDWITSCLKEKGFGITVRTSQGELAGVLIVYFPGENVDNLGREIGLSGEALTQVAHMDTAVVAKAHRGHGLERRMVEYAEDCLKGTKYRYLMATVSPDNPASLRSLEKNGYRVMMTKEKYGGYQRDILLKDTE